MLTREQRAGSVAEVPVRCAVGLRRHNRAAWKARGSTMCLSKVEIALCCAGRRAVMHGGAARSGAVGGQPRPRGAVGHVPHARTLRLRLRLHEASRHCPPLRAGAGARRTLVLAGRDPVASGSVGVLLLHFVAERLGALLCVLGRCVLALGGLRKGARMGGWADGWMDGAAIENVRGEGVPDRRRASLR